MSETVKIRLEGFPRGYNINIGNNLLQNCGEWIKSSLPANTDKVVIISNPKVFSLYGEQVVKNLEKENFKTLVWKIGDGEKYKSLKTLEKTLRFLGENKLKRTDAVIALGGGVVGDLGGFAAAVYLRGIAFLQIPTTLLSMIDSSVGGKTGINTDLGKNLLGAFHQPSGVLIDVNVLQTLARRELTAGFCEAVKQGAISDQKLFSQTSDFLMKYNPKNFSRYFSAPDFLGKLEKLIAAQVAFKAEIVKGDEQENLDRKDSRARKILNFGHTVAHALEKVTDYKYFKHGEAVGYGILAAAEISKDVANFVQSELKSLNDVVRMTGSLPTTQNIDIDKVIETFSFDKKNVGSSLQWVLLEKIGQPVIVGSEKISDSIIKKSIIKVLKGQQSP